MTQLFGFVNRRFSTTVRGVCARVGSIQLAAARFSHNRARVRVIEFSRPHLRHIETHSLGVTSIFPGLSASNCHA